MKLQEEVNVCNVTVGVHRGSITYRPVGCSYFPLVGVSSWMDRSDIFTDVCMVMLCLEKRDQERLGFVEKVIMKKVRGRRSGVQAIGGGMFLWRQTRMIYPAAITILDGG